MDTSIELFVCSQHVKREKERIYELNDILFYCGNAGDTTVQKGKRLLPSPSHGIFYKLPHGNGRNSITEERERVWKNGKGNKEKLDTYQDFFALVFQQDGRSTDFVTRSKRCQFQQVILVDNGYFEFCFAFDTSHSCVLVERRESKSQLLLRLVTKLQLEPSAITFPCQHV